MPIGKKPCPECGGPLYRGSARCAKCRDARRPERVPVAVVVPIQPAEQVKADRERAKLAGELAGYKHKYKAALTTIERLEEDVRTVSAFGDSINTFAIEPRLPSGTGEGTVVMVASDWHIEEIVKPGQISKLNEHTLEISKARATNFFTGGLRLIRMFQQDLRIDNLVLPLLGDFISNDIHDEFPENNALQPIHAMLEAQTYIASGIEFLLNHSTLDITMPCHSGNHARTTKTVRVSSENGHSLEYFMYRTLAREFKNEPRVKFIVPEGYHSYMDIYGKKLRFHHGHEINYQGGVGGIYIPVNKAIAQWNKAIRADLDVFGHFHQARDGGNFICNGSSIGYNAYALSIKADFETPRQQMFIIDKKRGRTGTWPILVN